MSCSEMYMMLFFCVPIFVFFNQNIDKLFSYFCMKSNVESYLVSINPQSATYNLQQTSISDFAAFSKIINIWHGIS